MTNYVVWIARDNDYFGQPLNRVARLLSVGHGGQTLLSDVAHDLTRDTLPAAAGLKPQESLMLFRELGNKYGIACGLEAFASLGIHEMEEERGACLWGAAAALRETIGSPLPPADREKQERAMTAVRERMGEDAFALAWAQGHVMTMEQAIEYARGDVVT